MLFNTPVFLIFLLITVFVFYFLPKKIDKYFLLFASYFFYGYWDWRFLFLLAGSSIMDFYLGKFIFDASTAKKKKLLLITSLIINLSVLGFFKYYNFFIDSFILVFGHKLDFMHLNIILPIGISFYTFQSLSYTIDIYKEKLKPTKSILDYCLFVGVFPHMQSGPIVRAIYILPQLEKLQKPRKEDFNIGFSLITIGMIQKVLIGDTASRYVDHIFANPKYYSSGELLFSIFMFSIQIYGDFAGYSNIARGSAKFFGIDLIDNFNQPFTSRSLGEFWRRWHISLSTWIFDYIYNPLVLSIRNLGKFGIGVALVITFFFSGLWHGAGYNFLLWGVLHGLGLSFEFYFVNLVEDYAYKTGKTPLAFCPVWIKKIISTCLTYSFLLFTWIFFRASSISESLYYLKRIFIDWIPGKFGFDLFVIFISYMFFVLLLDYLEIKFKTHEYLTKMKPAIRYGLIIPGWIAVILYMYTVGKPTPFIYFQF